MGRHVTRNVEEPTEPMRDRGLAYGEMQPELQTMKPRRSTASEARGRSPPPFEVAHCVQAAHVKLSTPTATQFVPTFTLISRDVWFDVISHGRVLVSATVSMSPLSSESSVNVANWVPSQ